MNTKKMSHANQGIRCLVNTCHYYMQGDQCSAERIEVAPKNASNSQDTDCETFLPES